MGVMQILRSAALGAALALVLSSSLAGPAPYYQYRSKLTGALACSPTPLGEGWVRSNGPYRDAHCEKPVLVK